MKANTKKLFNDIATRTGGDIYIGVVGPVRVGKSTFITNFMQSAVLPRVTCPNERKRATDELPQSASGTAIMTTQPRFVPSTAVEVSVTETTSMRVRMIDCVGYMVPGANGHMEDGNPRMVTTPWSNSPMPFEKAAEFGTKKVITEHSTIAIVMTTDGSITPELPRTNYMEAEEKVIAQLKKSKKPFIVVVNTTAPESERAQEVAESIRIKHSVTTLTMSVTAMTEDNTASVFQGLLAEFGVSGFKVTMPKWLQVLDSGHEIIAEAMDVIKRYTAGVRRLSDNDPSAVFVGSTNFVSLQTTNVCVATGIITFNIELKPELYYKVLSSQCGSTINNEQELVAYIRHAGSIKAEYEKLEGALNMVREQGYGVVAPRFSDFQLAEPTLTKSGKNFGVKLRATAPSLHIVRVDVHTDVTPSIGSQQQAQETLAHLQTSYADGQGTIWQTPIFGKTLDSIVEEGIQTKVESMPNEAKRKMKRCLTRIVNNGRGGVICILL